MRTYLFSGIATILACFAVGCGSNNNNPSCAAGQTAVNGTCQYTNGYYATNSCQGTCSPGMVQTTSGCLSQCSGNPCQGNLNGTCVQGIQSSNTSCQGTCAVGQVMTTSYGCQPQGSCSPCMGSYGGTCVPSSAIGTTTGYGTTGYGTAGSPYGYGTTGYGTTGYGTTGYGTTGYPYGYGTTGYGTTGYPYGYGSYGYGYPL